MSEANNYYFFFNESVLRYLHSVIFEAHNEMTHHSTSEHQCHAQYIWNPIETVKQAAFNWAIDFLSYLSVIYIAHIAERFSSDWLLAIAAKVDRTHCAAQSKIFCL